MRPICARASRSWRPTPSSPGVPKLTFWLIFANFSYLAASGEDEQVTELGSYSANTTEIKTSLGLNYKDQDILGKRFIWLVYIKRLSLHFYEKSKFRGKNDTKNFIGTFSAVWDNLFRF